MIIVTGMHRSGTSLTAQVLQALGADFGPLESLYEADRWNANGYLERVDVVDLNSQLLTGVARTTSRTDMLRSQVNYLRMPDDRSLRTRTAGLHSEVQDLAGQLDGLFVKDPRFCATLPAWHEAGDVHGLVVALRHPTASVASLRKRNRLPGPLGHRFWRWHMERVLPWIDERTLVIRQEQLTGPDHDEEVERVRQWLRDVAGIPASVDAPTVLDRGLVHHQGDAATPAASEALWNRLLETPCWEPQP